MIFKRLISAAMRRIAVSDHSVILCCPINELTHSTEFQREEFRFDELPISQVTTLLRCTPELDASLFCSLDDARFRCFVIFLGRDIIAYTWVGTGVIPAEHNSNGHPWTGIPISLAPNTAYLFAAFVAREFRGRRLYQQMVSGIGDALAETSTKQLLLTTGKENVAALRAIKRMGFQNLGETCFFACFSFCTTSYHYSPELGDNRFGIYQGDRKSRKTARTLS